MEACTIDWGRTGRRGLDFNYLGVATPRRGGDSVCECDSGKVHWAFARVRQRWNIARGKAFQGCLERYLETLQVNARGAAPIWAL